MNCNDKQRFKCHQDDRIKYPSKGNILEEKKKKEKKERKERKKEKTSKKSKAKGSVNCFFFEDSRQRCLDICVFGAELCLSTPGGVGQEITLYEENPFKKNPFWYPPPLEGEAGLEKLAGWHYRLLSISLVLSMKIN
jgi:hypothetical protein